VHIEGEGGAVKLANTPMKFKCLTDLVKYYSENETSDLQCVLKGAHFPTAAELKARKKQLEQQASVNGKSTSGKKVRCFAAAIESGCCLCCR